MWRGGRLDPLCPRGKGSQGAGGGQNFGQLLVHKWDSSLRIIWHCLRGSGVRGLDGLTVGLWLVLKRWHFLIWVSHSDSPGREVLLVCSVLQMRKLSPMRYCDLATRAAHTFLGQGAKAGLQSVSRHLVGACCMPDTEPSAHRVLPGRCCY